MKITQAEPRGILRNENKIEAYVNTLKEIEDDEYKKKMTDLLEQKFD